MKKIEEQIEEGNRQVEIIMAEVRCPRTTEAVGSSRQVAGLNAKGVRKKIDTNGAEHRNEHGGKGLIRSTSANGGMTLGKEAVSSIQTASLEQVMHRTGIFEFFWYPIFVVLGVLCLILIPIFTTMTTASAFLLVMSVLTLWMSMTGNNFVAKGYRIGLIITSIELAIYTVLCVYQKVWGEVIMNALVYIPLEILSFFRWKKMSQENGGNAKNDSVEKMQGTIMLWYALMLIGFTGAIWVFLNYALKQSFAIFNAISIAGCVVGDFARNKRYYETWFLYMICNIGGILLWACQVFLSGDTITLAILPAMITSIATLTNNFNGLYIWGKLYDYSHKNGGVILNERKVDIKKVAKLKRTFRKMTCKETAKVEK